MSEVGAQAPNTKTGSDLLPNFVFALSIKALTNVLNQ